jgi:uncharacterized membrane protein
MPRNVNKEHKESLGLLDKAALFITSIVGTMWCAIVFAIIAFISLPQAIAGGTAPIISWIAQTFLQLVLLSIIMVGQNLQSKHSELRAEADYETDVAAHEEIIALKTKLDKVLDILEKH